MAALINFLLVNSTSLVLKYIATKAIWLSWPAPWLIYDWKVTLYAKLFPCILGVSMQWHASIFTQEFCIITDFLCLNCHEKRGKSTIMITINSNPYQIDDMVTCYMGVTWHKQATTWVPCFVLPVFPFSPKFNDYFKWVQHTGQRPETHPTTSFLCQLT